MRVTPCPICGRKPTIVECVPIKQFKNGIRRRLVKCPNYDSVIPCKDHLNRFGFMYYGDGDDNAIFKEWNKAIAIYESNSKKDEFVDWDKWEYYTEEL